MKKIANFFNDKIIKYFSNDGDHFIVSFSGGWTDFFTVAGMMLVWSIGADYLQNLWLFDTLGIILTYFIGRTIGILSTLILPETLTKNKRGRYLKAGGWLYIPYILIFFFAFFGEENPNTDNNW